MWHSLQSSCFWHENTFVRIQSLPFYEQQLFTLPKLLKSGTIRETGNDQILYDNKRQKVKTLFHHCHDVMTQSREHSPYGDDHCMTGLQFNWIGFEQTKKYVGYESKPNGRPAEQWYFPLRGVFFVQTKSRSYMLTLLNLK